MDDLGAVEQGDIASFVPHAEYLLLCEKPTVTIVPATIQAVPPLICSAAVPSAATSFFLFNYLNLEQELDTMHKFP